MVDHFVDVLLEVARRRGDGHTLQVEGEVERTDARRQQRAGGLEGGGGVAEGGGVEREEERRPGRHVLQLRVDIKVFDEGARRDERAPPPA